MIDIKSSWQAGGAGAGKHGEGGALCGVAVLISSGHRNRTHPISQCVTTREVAEPLRSVASHSHIQPLHLIAVPVRLRSPYIASPAPPLSTVSPTSLRLSFDRLTHTSLQLMER